MWSPTRCVINCVITSIVQMGDKCQLCDEIKLTSWACRGDFMQWCLVFFCDFELCTSLLFYNQLKQFFNLFQSYWVIILVWKSSLACINLIGLSQSLFSKEGDKPCIKDSSTQHIVQLGQSFSLKSEFKTKVFWPPTTKIVGVHVWYVGSSKAKGLKAGGKGIYLLP